MDVDAEAGRKRGVMLMAIAGIAEITRKHGRDSDIRKSDIQRSGQPEGPERDSRCSGSAQATAEEETKQQQTNTC